jgi:hypothetical protein
MSDIDDHYKNAFGLGTLQNPVKAKAALDLALDIRKFEIGLYWQRAAYFWALIAAAFAGYFAILSAEKLADREYLAYIVSCIGLIFSWAWFLVNSGSKYWQENWENHVDMLEDGVVGPLYKTILHRPSDRPFFEKYIFGPQAISVSRVNLGVSIFSLFIWIALILHSLPVFHLASPVSYKHVLIGTITVVFIVFMRLGSKTSLKPHELALTNRKTGVTRLEPVVAKTAADKVR